MCSRPLMTPSLIGCPTDGGDGPCRLCSANDLDALTEELAEELWDSRRHATLDDWEWKDASPIWKTTFRDLAETAIVALGARHQERL